MPSVRLRASGAKRRIPPNTLRRRPVYVPRGRAARARNPLHTVMRSPGATGSRRCRRAVISGSVPVATPAFRLVDDRDSWPAAVS